VVLEVGRPGNVVPFPSALDSVFGVVGSRAEQIVSKVVSSKVTVKLEVTLRILKPVLVLFIEQPSEAHLHLVTTLGPGNIIADLVTIGLVIPRHPVGRVVRTCAAV